MCIIGAALIGVFTSKRVLSDFEVRRVQRIMNRISALGTLVCVC